MRRKDVRRSIAGVVVRRALLRRTDLRARERDRTLAVVLTRVTAEASAPDAGILAARLNADRAGFAVFGRRARAAEHALRRSHASVGWGRRRSRGSRRGRRSGGRSLRGLRLSVADALVPALIAAAAPVRVTGVAVV